MAYLIYNGECKADSKGRVMLPVGLKKELAPMLNAGFVLKKNPFHECLDLFPKAEWDKEMEEVLELNRNIKKNDVYVRMFLNGVKPVEIDGTGRLLIPKDLIAFANFKKEIVVASQINKVEIWDKATYTEWVRKQNEEQDFGDLTEDVRGGKRKEDEG